MRSYPNKSYLCTVFTSFWHFPRATFLIFHPCIDFSPEMVHCASNYNDFFNEMKIQLQTEVMTS